MYRNVHNRTHLKPVNPKALLLQYGGNKSYECNESKTTIEIPYGQNPKWKFY